MRKAEAPQAEIGQAKLTLARRSFLAFSFQPRNNFPPVFESGLSTLAQLELFTCSTWLPKHSQERCAQLPSRKFLPRPSRSDHSPPYSRPDLPL